MKISLIPFVIAVALLWVPRSWMHRGMTVWRWKSRRRNPQPSTDGVSLLFRREFTKTRNYYDLGRAAAGTWALVGGGGVDAAVSVVRPAAPGAAQAVWALQIGILLVALLIQLVRWERGHLSLTAPVFFLFGMTLGSGPVAAAMSAFAISWALTAVNPNSQGFLTVQALVLGLVGFVLGGDRVLLTAGVLLCFLPVLISLLARRPLMVLSRRGVPAPTRSVTV